jgi:demethylmenaquinone methyltransferase/2-methoxy-6-polyprenyl-1,4-benzoquinol methylase
MNRPLLEPHPALKQYYADQAQRPVFVRALFDRTAPYYDRINLLLSWGTGDWYRRYALQQAGLQPGMRVLDVATGTGLVARQAVALTKSEDTVVGLDISDGMLVEAQRTLQIHLIQGKAEQLSFADASFDFLSMGYALRHVTDLETTFREFHRVLRPQGTLLLLEISRPSSQLGHRLLNIYLGRLIPWLSRWISGNQEMQTLMRYYWDTIEHCVPVETILQTLVRAGFVGTGCAVDLGICRAYSGRKA